MTARGQLSILILLGVFMILGAAFYIATSTSSYRNKTSAPVASGAEHQSAEAFVRSCLTTSAQEALIDVGNLGGSPLGASFTNDPGFNTSYHIMRGKSIVLTVSQVETSIARHIERTLPSCINDWSGPRMTLGKPNVRVELLPTKTIAHLAMNVVVDSPGGEERINAIDVEIPDVRLSQLIEVSSALTKEQSKDTENICLSCVYELSEKHGLLIDMRTISENTIAFIISDFTEKAGHRFIFAYQYST